ncbi:MAG: uroporphyrinogen-III synthase [Candidatus Endonucleobacter bathymodioli]|uniref:Uroporphyrinogen-III synthase n=1 Tax=Candidatus Endonucleibacter bathymodioli TaxID=539814 RepID=A0AA90SYQ2_9GAMM|nr:uroporphyrinogen-III synthase [Candidatus Endonucleobacter bathymodioli]
MSSIRALVTRPKLQSQSLANAIKNLDGQAWTLPLIEIAPITYNQSIRHTLLALDQFNKIIVTSHHAARIGLNLIENYWPQLPLGLEWHALGPKTARALAYYGINTKIPPQGVNSESLLTMASLTHVRNEKILIIKGKGGRLLLEQTLKTRGANVECLDTYQRLAPVYPTNTLPNLLKCLHINVIICASGETVINLLNILPEDNSTHLNLIIPSQRVASQAIGMPFKQIIVSEDAGNNAMLLALAKLEQQQTTLRKTKQHSEELS